MWAQNERDNKVMPVSIALEVVMSHRNVPAQKSRHLSGCMNSFDSDPTPKRGAAQVPQLARLAPDARCKDVSEKACEQPKLRALDVLGGALDAKLFGAVRFPHQHRVRFRMRGARPRVTRDRIRRWVAAGMLAVATAASISACGTSKPQATAPAHPTRLGASKLSGRQVFMTAGCSSCHTLAGAHATGSIGPNLDQLKPAYATVVRQVTHGGGGMPSFAGQLSKSQIAAVARYVAKVAGHGA